MKTHANYVLITTFTNDTFRTEFFSRHRLAEQYQKEYLAKDNVDESIIYKKMEELTNEE